MIFSQTHTCEIKQMQSIFNEKLMEVELKEGRIYEETGQQGYDRRMKTMDAMYGGTLKELQDKNNSTFLVFMFYVSKKFHDSQRIKSAVIDKNNHDTKAKNMIQKATKKKDALKNF